MSEVIISNEVEDYADCVGMILRNRHYVAIGTIVDLEVHITAMYHKRRVVFVLDDGRKAFADETRLARKKFQVTEALTKAYSENADSVLSVKVADKTAPFAIGKGIYRDGEYVGTVVRRSNDGFGEYVVLNNSMKIHVPTVGEDEILDIEDEILDIEDEVINDEVVDDVIVDEIL